MFFISSAANSFHTVAFDFCPGLRCRADSECKSWRWTHPDVFLNGDLYVGPLNVPVDYDHTFSTAMHCEKIQKNQPSVRETNSGDLGAISRLCVSIDDVSFSILHPGRHHHLQGRTLAGIPLSNREFPENPNNIVLRSSLK